MILALIGWSYTLLIVLVSWVFFRAVDVNHALRIINAMFSLGSLQSSAAKGEVMQVFAFAGLLGVAQIPLEGMLHRLQRNCIPIHYAVVVAFFATLLGVVLGAPASQPFIYFQF